MGDLLDKLAINPQVLLFMIINFLVLLIALKFIILKPLSKAIKERQEKIDKGLDLTDELEKKVAEIDKEYKAKLTKASEESKKMIAETKVEMSKFRQDEIDKVKEETEVLFTRAKSEVETSKQNLRSEVKKEVGQVIEEVLSSFIKSELTKEQKQKLVDEAINSLQK